MINDIKMKLMTEMINMTGVVKKKILMIKTIKMIQMTLMMIQMMMMKKDDKDKTDDEKR